jgi:ATP-dependent DNA helicase RecG
MKLPSTTTGICEHATRADLDPDAIPFAREQYKAKHPRMAAEVDTWDEATFLSKARVCIRGEVTNTAVLLLGKDEVAHLLLLPPMPRSPGSSGTGASNATTSTSARR